MKAKITRIVTDEIEIEIKWVDIEVAVRYGVEDMPQDFPFRVGDVWAVQVDIDTGIIKGWPQGYAGEFYMKICDEGTYRLLATDGTEIASIEENYVPNALLPGQYGDYLEMKIDATGKVTNWLSNPSLSNFFPDSED